MDESRDSGSQSGWPSEWPRPPEVGTAPSVPEAAARRSPRGVLAAVGLLLAGALAGGIGIAAVQHGGATATVADSAQGTAAGSGAPGQQGQLGQQGQGLPDGGPGRDDDGEQRFVGTLTAVSGSSVTVRTSAGTTTYQVGSDTQVVKDGRLAGVSDLAAGDRVLMHVIAAGGSPTVERIVAGPLPQQDGPGAEGTTTGLRT